MTDPEQTAATPTTADIANGIRTALATIRRHWAGTRNPAKRVGVGARSMPASRLPGSADAISLRAEVTADLAFWVHALADQYPDAVDEALLTTRRVPVPTLTFTTTWIDVRDVPGRIDLADIPATCELLSNLATTASGWGEHAHRMWAELEEHAEAVKQLAAPPVRETMPIGECECGTIVRAKAHDPGNIKCRGCTTVDTLDGWIIRIVGNEPLVTAEQLIPILHKRMGIVASRAVIRGWKHRGVIHSSGTDAHGRTVYDRKAVFAALSTWEAKREGRVGA